MGYVQTETAGARHGPVVGAAQDGGGPGALAGHRSRDAQSSRWRDGFLAGGEAHLKAREVAVEDDETRRLKNVVADLATEKDLLKEKIRHLEASGPVGWWRSKR